MKRLLADLGPNVQITRRGNRRSGRQLSSTAAVGCCAGVARGVPFEDYAALVIKHALADHARKNQKRRAIFAAPAQDDDPEPADHRHAQAGDDADRVELAELIRKTLPPRPAEVLFLVAEGVTLEEIGWRFGVCKDPPSPPCYGKHWRNLNRGAYRAGGS
jgi:hypothetical protein